MRIEGLYKIFFGDGEVLTNEDVAAAGKPSLDLQCDRLRERDTLLFLIGRHESSPIRIRSSESVGDHALELCAQFFFGEEGWCVVRIFPCEQKTQLITEPQRVNPSRGIVYWRWHDGSRFLQLSLSCIHIIVEVWEKRVTLSNPKLTIADPRSRTHKESRSIL